MNTCVKNLGKTALSRLDNPALLVGDCYVGGAWIKGDSVTEVLDPATGFPVLEVAYYPSR